MVGVGVSLAGYQATTAIHLSTRVCRIFLHIGEVCRREKNTDENKNVPGLVYKMMYSRGPLDSAVSCQIIIPALKWDFELYPKQC